MLSQEFIAEMKQKLEAQKAQFEADLAAQKLHTEVGEEEDENATEIQMDEVSQDLVTRMQQDLEKVQNALLKIEQGTYGVDESGAEISEERLRAIPWADTAI